MAIYATNVLLDDEKDHELWFRSEMTHRQFLALAYKLNNSDIENEIINLDFFKNRLKAAQNLNLKEVEKWLRNAWNTENILHSNSIIIAESAQPFALQWAFPQAYYSVFGTLSAHYNALGYTETSHTAVIRKFGRLVTENKLPESVCFLANGGRKRITYSNISKPTNHQSIDLDLSIPETVDHQICQFLKTSREIKLMEKAPELIKALNIKTAKGSNKKHLSPGDWQKISDQMGITTILDLLYRKRIKANYLDTEIFTFERLKGKEILENLCTIVNRLNLINETYVAKAIKEKEYLRMKNEFSKRLAFKVLDDRCTTVLTLINS
jgi:uncharacterized protein (UPF0332 family)